MTTFFDLPPELRQIIYRKTRFLVAKYQLNLKLLEHNKNHLIIKKRDYYYCMMYVSPFKTLAYEIYFCGIRDVDFIIVDVVDYTSVKLSIFVNMFENKICSLNVITEYSCRNVVYKTPTLNHDMSKKTTQINQWYNGHFHKIMVDHFNKNYIKT